jgi:hypothetical protein
MIIKTPMVMLASATLKTGKSPTAIKSGYMPK